MEAIQITVIFGALMLIIIVMELVRRRTLKEKYSLLWLLTGGLILISAVFPSILALAGEALGVSPMSVLLIIAFILLMVIALGFSIFFSTLYERVKELAQNVVILDWEIKSIMKAEMNPRSRLELLNRFRPADYISKDNSDMKYVPQEMFLLREFAKVARRFDTQYCNTDETAKRVAQALNRLLNDLGRLRKGVES